MNTAEIINSMKEHVAAAYTAVTGKNGTIPEQKNLSNLAAAIDSIQVGSSAENPYKARTYSEMNGYRTKNYGNAYVEYTGQRQFTRNQIQDSSMYDKLYFDFPRQIGWVETFDWDNPDSNWTSDGLLYKCIVLFNVTPTKISDNTTEEAVPFSVYQMTATRDSSDVQAGTVMYGIGFPSSFSWVSWGGTPDKEYSRTGYKLKITNVKDKYRYFIGDIISTTGKWSQIVDGMQFGYKHGTYKIDINSKTVDNFQKLDLVLEDGGGGTASKSIVNNYSYNLNSSYDYILKYSYEGKSSSIICKVGSFSFESNIVAGAKQLYNATSDGKPYGILFELDANCPLPSGWNSGIVVDNFDLTNPEQSTSNKSCVNVGSGLYTLVGKTVTIEDISTAANMIYYTTLPSLSAPAAARDIVKGKQAIDAEGNRIEGTLESGSSAENKLAQYASGELTEVTAKDLKDITTINPYAFAFCNGLTSVTIPDNVTTIGSGAFYACPELSSVTIGSGVTNMEEGAFYSCSKLTTVYYTGDVASWCKISGSGFESLMSNVTTLYINGQKVEGDLVIPNDVTNINNYAFYNCKDLTSLTIGNSVTSIGNYAFRNCSGLTSITIPNSVTNIGYSAFENCTGLIDIVIPNSTVNIGSSAFSGCSSLTSITGSTGATSTVANQARPTSSFVVVITSGTSIGYGAFRSCTGLTNVTISDSVTSIGDSAFWGCSGLTSVTIPNNVTNIGNQAFCNCSGLTSIIIPNSVNSIGSYAFQNCSNLQDIYITDIAAWCNILGLNYLMSFDVGNKKNLYLNNELITSITIPDTVTNINSSAFSNCIELTSIIIPSSVTSIGERAFYNCSGLTSIIIPDSVTSINDYAFQGCINLTSITGPANVTSTIVNQAKPTSSFIVTITSGESINNSAFRDYTDLTSITISDSVISIGDYAFSGCSGLTSITIGNSVTSIGSYVFQNCNKLTNIAIPNSVTSIGSGAFAGCSGLTDMIIPNNVTSIENSVFYNCESLTDITIPDNVISIGKTAFCNCNGLTSITVPDKVTSVGESAFSGCSSLTSITASASIASTIANQVKPTSSFVIVITSGESINSSAFSSCTGLTSITIPDSVTSIGDYAFHSCVGLTDIVIPNGVTSIGKSAFYQCRGLINITIGSSVASIGENAFYNCANLRSIIVNEENTVYHSSGNCLIETSTKTLILGCNTSIIPSDDSITSIYKEAFLNRTNLTNVTIGSSITSIGTDAFKGCYRLVEVYNKSSLTITAGNSDNGYVAYYAKNVYTTEDGSKLSTDENGYITYTNETEKILVAYTGTETNLVLPSDITGINQYTFADCKNLMNITIPDNVINIGDSAFYNCIGLTDITIGNGVTSIGKEAFYSCSALTNIIIPDSVASIGGNAFQGCAGLTNITISNAITKINTSTFYGCSGLTDVIIPNSVTYISNFAFDNCTGLTSIVIPDGVTSIDNYAFGGCSGLTSITIGEGTTNIAPYAFQDCSGLTSIIVNERNTKYHSSGNCLIETSTKTLILGCNTSIIPSDGSVTSINREAFKGYGGLISVVIPDGVTSIGTNAFENCSNLTSVIIPDSLTNINDYVFSDCISLTDITIGNGVKSIGRSAFYNCNKLTTVLYTGTQEQWTAISINSYGNNYLTSAAIIYNYDGIERTYSFVTNNDQNINPITATYLTSLPTLTRDGYHFFGWYDNETFEGEAVSAPYYSKDKTTLYAKWLTQEELDALRDGTSFEKAYIAKSGQTYDVNITSGGQIVYFTFTPTTNGSFTIQSTGNADTYGTLYSSTQSSLAQDDDGAGGRNFKITHNMTANTTYYVAAKLYSSSSTGAFKVKFS